MNKHLALVVFLSWTGLFYVANSLLVGLAVTGTIFMYNADQEE